MTVELNPTSPNPPPAPPSVAPLEPRPDLRLVDPTAEPPATDPQPAVTAQPQPSGDVDQGQAAMEESAEQSPALTPLAPLDQRLIAHIKQIFQLAPRWSQRPAALAEIWEYSTSGDWTAEEKSAKRLGHALIVVVTFVVLYPVWWVIQAALEKPIGFISTIAILLVLRQVL